MRRNMHYDVLGEPLFRVRAIPRRLTLDVAKHDSDPLVPAELAAYAARSRGSKAARTGQAATAAPSVDQA